MFKKLLTLAAFMAVGVGWGNLAHAQTDVTDTYLTNPGFEDGEDGWTYQTSSGTRYNGILPYGSSEKINGIGISKSDKFGNTTGKAICTAAGWGTVSYYTQEVTLPAGTYKITFDVFNNRETTGGTSRLGWVPNGGDALYSTTEFTYNMWRTHAVNFTLTEETTGNISIGVASVSGSGSGSCAHLYIDNVKIFQMDAPSAITISKPIDYSDLINQTTWSYNEDDGAGSASSLTTNVNKGAWPYRHAERYRGMGGHYGKKLYQTIEGLPAGVYQVQASCMSAAANGVEGGNALPDGTLDNAYFYANEVETTYPLANATSAFQKQIVTLTEAGSIEFGVKTVAVGANWNAISCATLIKVAENYSDYMADLLATSYDELKVLIDDAESIKDSEMGDAEKDALDAALATATAMYDGHTATSVADIEEEKGKLETAIAAAQASIAKMAVYNNAVATINGGTNVDLTALIGNPSFEETGQYVLANGGWINEGVGIQGQNNSGFDGYRVGNMFAERWANNTPIGAFKTYQIIEYLPAGIYEVSAVATFNGEGASLLANGGTISVTDAGTYKILAKVTEKGALELGVQGVNPTGSWFKVDDFKLIYVGSDFPAYTLVDAPMNATVKEAQTNAASAFESDKTVENYNALLAAIAAAQSSANAYAPVGIAISRADAFYASATSATDEAKATFNENYNPIKAAYINCEMSDDEAESAALDIYSALAPLAKSQTAANSDMTYAIVNPFIDGADGWTTDISINGNGPLLNGTAFEYWSYTEGKGGFDYYQTITGLPAGKYTVTAYMFNSLSDKPDFEFVPGAGVYGTSAETKIAPVTEEGQVWHFYTTDPIIVTDGTLRIGIKNTNADNTMPARWVAADDFKLTFVEGIQLQDYWDEIDALVAEAEAITGRQGTTPAAALTEAITNGQAASGHETDLDAIEAVIEALNTAIANSNASVAAYAIITAGVIPTNNAEGWTKDTPNGGLACNGWSTEANTDGSGMTTPFIQVHRGANDGSLGAGRLYYTISNLEPGDKFVVSARARVYNEAAGSLDGGSFFVNETKVDIDEKGIACAGDYANKGIYGVFYAIGTVDTEGKLQFGIEVAEGSELNWIAIKDVTIKDFTDTKLSEITVSPNAPTMTTGTTMTLTATVTPADADDPTVMWTSSDPTVATVNNAGFVTALKAGTTTITVTANDGGAEATTEITVADATAPAFYATEIATATDYYIVNAATGKFLGGGNDYGTRASLIEHGIPFTITKEASGKYTLDSHVYNGANSHYFRGDYVDQTSKDNIYITPMEGGRFSISTAENAKYVTAAAGNTIVADNAADAISSLAQWYFVTKEDMENALVAATAENPLDATFYIGDPNFSRNMLIDKMQNGQTTTYYEESYPWTIEASNFNLKGGDQPNFCAESYHSAFTLSQELTVPNGTYKLRAQAASNGNNEDVFIYATAGETTITTPFNAMVNGESSMSAMSAQFSAGNYYTDWIEVTVTDHKLTIGAKTERTDTWCIWDNFELYMTGYTPVTEVTASIDNSEIEVNGTAQITASVTEGASFDAISYESSDVTVATVDENGLVTAVAEGTATITVKAEMENVSEEINVTVVKPAVIPSEITVMNGEDIITALELDATTNEVTLTAVVGKEGAPQAVVWASDDETVATVSAEGVVTGVAPGTASITVTASGYDDVYATVEVTVAYPESTIPATVEVIDETEMTKTIYTLDDTNLIKNGSFEYPNAFYGWTAADDNTLSTTNFETLTTDAPNGNAYLHAKSNGGKDSDASIGTKWAIEHNKTYIFGYETKVNANGNAEYHKVSLTSNPNAEQYQVSKDSYPLSSTEWTKVQYKFESGNYDYLQFRARWLSGNASFDNFYLAEVTDADVTDLSATADDYAALNEAIESKTLGFLEGEYAPYNNVGGVQALNAAKAIDQSVKNWADDVKAATEAINDATWTANTEEVNAVFDGSFETDYSGQTGNINPIGWQRVKGAAADGYNVRYVKSTQDAGVEATSSGKGLFTKQSAYYGYAEGYTMPLKANTYYKVSFIYGGWSDCKKDGYVSIADPAGDAVEILPTDLPLDAVDANTNKNSWKTYEAIFQTGEAGDYVLGLRKKNYDTSGQSQYVYGDIQIFQVPVSEVTMKILKDNKYGTFVAPFEVTLPDGVTAQKVIDLSGTTLVMEDVNEVIPAHTPVVIYKGDIEDDVFTETFSGQATTTQTEATEGLLTGVYTGQKAPAGKYVLQNIGGKVAFYHVADGEEPTMRPYSAYLTLPEGYAKPISLSFGDDEATAIAGIEALTSGNMEGIYTTSGAKVNSLQKGVNIIRTKDGKSMKVYVK